jgi:hypothetical protein
MFTLLTKGPEPLVQEHAVFTNQMSCLGLSFSSHKLLISVLHLKSGLYMLFPQPAFDHEHDKPTARLFD